MIGGPNGSGKSALIRLWIERGADLGLHLNADEIAKDLGDFPDASTHAQELVREWRSDALASGVRAGVKVGAFPRLDFALTRSHVSSKTCR